MATPKRATSSTTRTKKPTSRKAQETTVVTKSNGNGNGSSVTSVNAEELIRYRAYQLFEQRGRTHGYDKEDWLRAESEVTPSTRHTA